MAQPETRLSVLAEPRVLSCPADMHQNELAEMFDKYNLHALPVVDSQGRMVGVVQAEQVISFLREKLLGPWKIVYSTPPVIPKDVSS